MNTQRVSKLSKYVQWNISMWMTDVVYFHWQEDMLDEYFLAHDEKDCLTSDRTLSSLSTPRMDQEVSAFIYIFCLEKASQSNH